MKLSLNISSLNWRDAFNFFLCLHNVKLVSNIMLIIGRVSCIGMPWQDAFCSLTSVKAVSKNFCNLGSSTHWVVFPRWSQRWIKGRLHHLRFFHPLGEIIMHLPGDAFDFIWCAFHLSLSLPPTSSARDNMRHIMIFVSIVAPSRIFPSIHLLSTYSPGATPIKVDILAGYHNYLVNFYLLATFVSTPQQCWEILNNCGLEMHLNFNLKDKCYNLHAKQCNV